MYNILDGSFMKVKEEELNDKYMPTIDNVSHSLSINIVNTIYYSYFFGKKEAFNILDHCCMLCSYQINLLHNHFLHCIESLLY